ncbi:MAG: DegV family EDD domain-containing protein [Ruminococcaceae bacterium]|nr:DegV family EDD domain-containing protein [Oscillospiraceae bacterium]
MEKFKIVADSASDVLTLEKVSYAYAPLKIITSEKEYLDDKNLDVRKMVDNLLEYKGKSSTSCPNPDDWIQAFGDAENIFCVTITGTLSGSHNAANLAKNIYEEMYPERKVCVINSLSTGPEMKLIIDKLQYLILQEKEFDEICEEINEYCKNTGLFFILESMKNLANNGRVSPLVAKAAGLLGIRVLGMASEIGDLQMLDKCRGREKVVAALIRELAERGLKKGKVFVGHCFNEDTAVIIKEKIREVFPEAKVEIYNLRGLCSFYAEKGGLIIGYEKF